jgi:hypothetical protein
MIRKRALERWVTKLGNCECTSQAPWLISKSLSKMDEPKAPSAIHCPLGPIFYPIDKANIIADCFKKQFRAHDMCDCDHKRNVEAQVEARLATVDEDSPLNFRPCAVSKEIQSSKLGKACGFDGILNEYFQCLPRRPLVHLTHLSNHCLWLGGLLPRWKEANL